MTVTAPREIERAVGELGAGLGDEPQRSATSAASPTGTLTMKIHGHDDEVGEHAAQQQPDRAAAGGDRAPHAERLGPLVRVA